MAYLNTVNETAVGGLQLVSFQGQNDATLTAGRQDAVQVFECSFSSSTFIDGPWGSRVARVGASLRGRAS